ECPAPFIIIATTIIQMAFSYASIPLITLFTGRNIVNDFATVFGLKNFAYLDYLAPSFIFFLALVQETLSFVIINEEIKKFGFELQKDDLNSWSMNIFLFASLLLVVIFALTYKPLSYVALLIALYFASLMFVGLIDRKKKWIFIALGGSLLASIFIFALIYQYLPSPLGLLCVGVVFFFVLIIGFIDNCLLKHQNKNSI
ncbi:MAG: hypothetical protein K6F07_02385, partial [Bacilli bacterium]|nr:hypothetical protein [Bacilli bacterium]